MTRSRNRKGRRNRYVYDVPQKESQINDGTLTLDQIKQLATKMSKGTRGRRPSDCSFVSAYAASEKHKTPQLYFAFKGDDMLTSFILSRHLTDCTLSKETDALSKNMRTAKACAYQI